MARTSLPHFENPGAGKRAGRGERTARTRGGGPRVHDSAPRAAGDDQGEGSGAIPRVCAVMGRDLLCDPVRNWRYRDPPIVAP